MPEIRSLKIFKVCLHLKIYSMNMSAKLQRERLIDECEF